jgi:hypothetical protein
VLLGGLLANVVFSFSCQELHRCVNYFPRLTYPTLLLILLEKTCIVPIPLNIQQLLQLEYDLIGPRRLYEVDSIEMCLMAFFPRPSLL